MAVRKVPTPEAVARAVTSNDGNISRAAAMLNCSRSTVYKIIQENTELEQIVQDARETIVDLAESALRGEIEAGNITAIIFVLKTVGRTRGYSERVEHSGGIDVNFTDARDNLAQRLSRIALTKETTGVSKQSN